MSQILRIAWIAVRELIYERVFYVLLMFAGMALGLSMMLGQLTYAQQSKLTLDFMLAGIQISMVLFCVFMGIGLFKKELTLGSVSMVLSKPIGRSTFLLGKFFGQIFVQFVVILVMILTTILIASPETESGVLSLVQTSILIFFEVTILTAITYFFAVNAGGITTAVVTLSIFCLGHLQGSIAHNIRPEYKSYTVWKIAQGMIPNLEIFNMKSLASYGHAMGWT